jgi:hypothetical protein
MASNVLPRDSDGQFSAYAWPGGYPIVYIMEDEGILCPACANGKNGSDATIKSSDCPDDKQWHIIGADIHYEGEPIICDHCNAQIESAYGDPKLGYLSGEG